MPRYGPRNPHPLSQVQGELVWAGKYDVYGRRRTPAPVAVNPPPVPVECWVPPGTVPGEAPAVEPNRLYGGDNLLALSTLREAYAGQVQLVYIDPPFASDTDYLLRVPLGGDEAAPGGRLALTAYRDGWGQGSAAYLAMMHERLVLLRDLLRETGVLFLHCDWRMVAPLRLLLDEVFGPDRFLNEIVWYYYNKYAAGRRRLPRAHDTLLLYARGPHPALNPLRLPREQPRRQLVRESVNGVLKNARDAEGRLRYRVVTERKGDDVWKIPQLQPASREWTGYGTQKHHDLLRRVIELGSAPGDLVVDVFAGSGTTLAVAEALGRRWLGCDAGGPALHVARRRLLSARNPAAAGEADRAAPLPSFEMVDVQAATRRHWFRQVLGGSVPAYREAVLTACGAEPHAHAGHSDVLHGRHPDGACHVAAPGTTLTASVLRRLSAQAAAAGARRLLVLAWRFAPGVQEALAAGPAAALPVVPVLIPPALAAPGTGGRLPFRELPRLEARLHPAAPDEAGRCVELLAYVPGAVYGAENGGAGLPADGLDWLEGWSVDFAWRKDAAFRHDWWAYRPRRGGRPLLRSAPVPAGGGRPAVLAMDVFGLASLHPLPRC